MQEGTPPAKSMGIGCLSNPNVVIKRKFRWTFEAEFPFGKLSPNFVRISQRPRLKIEEEKSPDDTSWIPGKSEWNDLEVKFYSVTPDDCKELMTLIGEMYKFHDISKYDIFKPVEPPEDQLGTCTIKMLDGCGNQIEEWELAKSYFKNVSFGELDYSSSSEIDIIVMVNYKECKYKSMVIAPIPEMTEIPVVAPKTTMGLGKLGNTNVYMD
jgi:hypothetical protein